MTLYMLVGLPGSGKSTFSEKLKNKMTVISSDDIRRELGCLGDMSRNNEVFDILVNRVNSSIKDNDTVIDACNISVSSRNKIIGNIDTKCKKIAIVMNNNLDRCINNNNNRDNKISDSIIENMYKRYEEPSKSEGFDGIIKF